MPGHELARELQEAASSPTKATFVKLLRHFTTFLRSRSSIAICRRASLPFRWSDSCKREGPTPQSSVPRCLRQLAVADNEIPLRVCTGRIHRRQPLGDPKRRLEPPPRPRQVSGCRQRIPQPTQVGADIPLRVRTRRICRRQPLSDPKRRLEPIAPPRQVPRRQQHVPQLDEANTRDLAARPHWSDPTPPAAL